jgi:DNA-binding transcriptional ArsR family regulator
MNIFSALADPTRRSILELLAQHEQLPAAEICAQFPISPPAISQHLKVLREAELVVMEKRAQQHLYRINPPALLALESWSHGLLAHSSQRYAALDQVLEAQKKKLAASGSSDPQAEK